MYNCFLFMAPFFFNTFLSLSVFRVGQPKDSSHNPAPGKGDTQWCQAAWVGVGLVGRGQGGRMSRDQPSVWTFHRRLCLERASHGQDSLQAAALIQCRGQAEAQGEEPGRGLWAAGAELGPSP